MALLNPDLDANGYVFIPANRVTGIFSRFADAQEGLRALKADGWDDQHVIVFCGVEGADKLDLPGEQHGAVFRMIRKIEAIVGDVESDVFPDADAALRKGGCVVGVLMDGKEEQKEEVAAILKASHGQSIQYWGHWTVEKLA